VTTLRNSDGLTIRDLSIGYRTPNGLARVLRQIDLTIEAGSVVGLVGESGSGKSTLAFAISQYLSPNADVLGGSIELAGEDLLSASDERLRVVRGSMIGMVYQDPGTALNPTMRLGEQLVEGLRDVQGLDHASATQRGLELLNKVNLPDPEFIMRRFPHEVSGGEKQRVLIAMAFSCQPKLLVFDEPTTALDATTAAGILDLIRSLQAETGVAVLYITHDLGNVAHVAQRVNVIYAGQIVEEGTVEEVLRRPRHPYTRILMASVPNPYQGGERRRLPTFTGPAADLIDIPTGCIFQVRCPFAEEKCRRQPVPLLSDADHKIACIGDNADGPLTIERRIRKIRPENGVGAARPVLAVQDLNVRYGRPSLFDQLLRRPSDRVNAVVAAGLEIGAGETVGLVGESGCGKSSLARALVGLTPFEGRVGLSGHEITHPGAFSAEDRRAVQIVFQHPDLSLNPRMTVGEIVGRPLQLYDGLGGMDLTLRVGQLLEEVRLPAAFAERRPFELSGGEKQRVAIARAFAPRPQLVICDEITSGLDVSVQASMLNLLADLQDEHGTAYLFISHDLNLVQHFADRVVVMYLGRIVEERRTDTGMLMPPYHPYTEALLSAVPVPEPTLEARRVRLTGALPSPKNPPPGCCFNTRCWRKLGDICTQQVPDLVGGSDGHRLACHIPRDQLAAIEPIWSTTESSVT